MSAIVVAWFLLAWVAILYAARVLIADLRSGRDDDQQSWAIPEQRVSGRF